MKMHQMHIFSSKKLRRTGKTFFRQTAASAIQCALLLAGAHGKILTGKEAFDYFCKTPVKYVPMYMNGVRNTGQLHEPRHTNTTGLNFMGNDCMKGNNGNTDEISSYEMADFLLQSIVMSAPTTPHAFKWARNNPRFNGYLREQQTQFGPMEFYKLPQWLVDGINNETIEINGYDTGNMRFVQNGYSGNLVREDGVQMTSTNRAMEANPEIHNAVVAHRQQTGGSASAMVLNPAHLRGAKMGRAIPKKGLGKRFNPDTEWGAPTTEPQPSQPEEETKVPELAEATPEEQARFSVLWKQRGLVTLVESINIFAEKEQLSLPIEALHKQLNRAYPDLKIEDVSMIVKFHKETAAKEKEMAAKKKEHEEWEGTKLTLKKLVQNGLMQDVEIVYSEDGVEYTCNPWMKTGRDGSNVAVLKETKASTQLRHTKRRKTFKLPCWENGSYLFDLKRTALKKYVLTRK